jgi:hypothetical protein
MIRKDKRETKRVVKAVAKPLNDVYDFLNPTK